MLLLTTNGYIKSLCSINSYTLQGLCLWKVEMHKLMRIKSKNLLEELMLLLSILIIEVKCSFQSIFVISNNCILCMTSVEVGAVTNISILHNEIRVSME